MKKMMLIMVMLAAVCFAQKATLECRTWTVKSGTTVEGTLLKYYFDPKNSTDAVMITLKETGKPRGLAYQRLSDEDKAYVEKLVADGVITKQ